MFQALQEPNVNPRELLNTFNGVAFLKGLSNGEDTQVSRIGQFFVKVIKLSMIVADEAVHTLSNHAETFLDHLLERAADRHNLTNRFHRRTDLTADTGELSQVPTGNLADHIIKTRGYIST